MLCIIKRDRMEKKYLFAPGPVLTTERVKKAALIPDLCHRRGDFEKIYSELRQGILKIVNASEKNYTSVVLTGSGSAANECVISSVFSEDSKALVISNGEFGNRLTGFINCYGISSTVLNFEWGEYPDVNKIEDALKNDSSITHILMVMHETSTGMINPVKEVSDLTKKYNVLFHLDAVSSVGGEAIDLDGWGVDYCTGVPNKAVGGQPGASFVVVKRERISEIENVPVRNTYLRLQKHIELAESINQTLNTPSVVMFNTFLESVRELLEEGLENRITRYKENASIIRKNVSAMGLKVLLDEKISSNTVTSVFLPQSISVNNFLDKMEEQGYVMYLGKGPLLEKNMFQIANMGQIFPDDSRAFMKVLERVFKDMSGI